VPTFFILVDGKYFLVSSQSFFDDWLLIFFFNVHSHIFFESFKVISVNSIHIFSFFVLIFRSFQSNWRGQRAKRRQAKLQSQSEDSLGDNSAKKLLVV